MIEITMTKNARIELFKILEQHREGCVRIIEREFG